jgi:hypothetical protein
MQVNAAIQGSADLTVKYLENCALLIYCNDFHILAQDDTPIRLGQF